MASRKALHGEGTSQTATRRVTVIVLITAIISAVIAFAAGFFVRSPAQVAADTAPPPPTRLTAPVEEGTLEDPLLLPGTVALGNVLELTPSGSSGIVTGSPLAVGQQFSAGSVIIEVNDRPVIYLQGAIPLLRDLQPGDRGEDVARLQEALAPWGASEPDGVWGAGTTNALRALYSAVGYAPPEQNVARGTELVFGAAAGGTILSVKSGPGVAVASPLIRATTSAPIVAASVTDAMSQLLGVGQRVMITGASIGGTGEGTITAVGGLGTGEDGINHAKVTVQPDADLPPGAIDGRVELSVTLEDNPASGLLVPIAAIRSDASGGNYLVVEREESTNHVEVIVQDTGAGQAIVQAPDGDLTVNDVVVVGVK